MSVPPVDSFPPIKGVQATTASISLDRGTSPPNFSAVPETTTPVSGTVPSQYISATSKVSQDDQFPQDVVELHQDPDVKDQIIVEYLDQSKRLVMQMPSEEELAVERGIAQELQQRDLQAAKLNESAGATGTSTREENSHGN